MKKRNLAVSLTLAAAMALTTACSGGSNTAQPLQHRRRRQKRRLPASTDGASSDLDTSNPITIAVAAPMTGDNSEYGIGFANAAK